MKGDAGFGVPLLASSGLGDLNVAKLLHLRAPQIVSRRVV